MTWFLVTVIFYQHSILQSFHEVIMDTEYNSRILYYIILYIRTIAPLPPQAEDMVDQQQQ